ncbi:MAG TPA: hypothetical protein VF681_03225 [Abditibacteriaceae bacterium]|jgi:hypothetical protein
MMQQSNNFLSPNQLQAFVVGLAGLAPDEIRKAKSLYIRNALSEFRAMQTSLKAFGTLQIFFAIIPLFWPILWMQRKGMNSATQLYEERIRNAITVWRDDLGTEVTEFEQQLTAIKSGA